MDIHLESLLARFEEQFALGPGLGPSCPPSLHSLPPSLLKSLYHHSAALFRSNPWLRLKPHHLLSLRVSKDSDWPHGKQPFPLAHFVPSPAPALHLYRTLADVAMNPHYCISNAQVLRLVFEEHTVISSDNKKMIRNMILEPSGPDRFPVVDVVQRTASGKVRYRNPTLDEVIYVYCFVKAVTLVHPLLEPVQDVSQRSFSGLFEPFIETVDVQLPVEVAKRGEFVAVTVSYPPGQSYEEKRRLKSPAKKATTEEEETARGEWSVLRQCGLCEKEFDGGMGVSCGGCQAVVYCGAVCQKQHWKDAHKGVCGLFKAMMEREEELAMSNLFGFSCLVESSCRWLDSVGVHQKGMWRRHCGCYSHYPFGMLPGKGNSGAEAWGGLGDGEYPPDSGFPSYLTGGSNLVLLSGWSEYYNLRGMSMSSPVAAILSYPLTVYHILTALAIGSKNRLSKGKDVVVHYLGPAGELDWMPAFAEIGHLLNGTGNIQIFMVGPEVPSNLSGTVSGVGSRLRVQLVRGNYQEQAASLSSPHVVVALNCGLDSYGSWGGAIDQIKLMNVPAFFTERSEVLSANAKQVLRGAGLHISHPVTPNPFRSPLQDQSPSTNLPSFSNGFIFGVNT